jgi:hypothetical protein
MDSTQINHQVCSKSRELKDTVDKPVTNPKKNRGKLNRALRMVGVPQMLI